jgi:hypothetical protein
MKRATPTQRQRVARALTRFGRTTELDWQGPTIDGGPPIRRLASRIAELRDEGWIIDSRERRHGLAVYRLMRKPLEVKHADLEADATADAMFAGTVGAAPARNAVLGVD